MGKLEDKVALVTGAGRGIGRGVALAIAEEGGAVGLMDIDGANVDETKALIEAMGGRAVSIRGDVAIREDCRRALEETVKDLGGLDILVNNAAWTPTPGLRLLEFDDETFGRVIDTNLWSTFYCMQMAHPHFMKRGGVQSSTSPAALGPSGTSRKGPMPPRRKVFAASHGQRRENGARMVFV